VLICVLNNVLDMGRNVLFIITICRCVLFVWALSVSWLDSTWPVLYSSIHTKYITSTTVTHSVMLNGEMI
jgi:hypothetical protein